MAQIDEARLAELIEVFGPEDFAMVADAFLEEAGQALAGLADMVGTGPSPTREEQMHYLVGAARNLGAVAFGDLCKRYQLSQEVFSAADFGHLQKMFQATSEAFADQIALKLNSAA